MPQGAGSIMEFFALDYAFSTLGSRKLCCEVYAFNSNVDRLHLKFRFAQKRNLIEHNLRYINYEDIICLAKFGTDWENERDEFLKCIFGATDPKK